MQRHPPEFGSRYLAFRWSVRAHNEINRLLGKPLLPWAEACVLWGFDKRAPSVGTGRGAGQHRDPFRAFDTGAFLR
ncbi:hypothetical protein BH20VER3_BH20VER3_00480 [soil metagenome]